MRTTPCWPEVQIKEDIQSTSRDSCSVCEKHLHTTSPSPAFSGHRHGDLTLLPCPASPPASRFLAVHDRLKEQGEQQAEAKVSDAHLRPRLQTHVRVPCMPAKSCQPGCDLLPMLPPDCLHVMFGLLAGTCWTCCLSGSWAWSFQTWTTRPGCAFASLLLKSEWSYCIILNSQLAVMGSNPPIHVGARSYMLALLHMHAGRSQSNVQALRGEPARPHS